MSGLGSRGIRPLPRLVVGLAAGGAGLFLVSRLDMTTIALTLRAADGVLLGAAVLCNLVFFLTRGLRWWLLTRMVAEQVSFWPATRISTIGVLMSSIYPGVGEAARLWLLKRHAVAATTSLALVVEERVLDTVAVVLLAAIALTTTDLVTDSTLLPGLAHGLIPIGIGVIALALGLAIVFRRHRKDSHPLVRPVQARILSFLAVLGATLHHLRRHPTTLPSLILTTLLAQALAFVTGWLAVAAIVPGGVSPAATLVLVALVSLSLGIFPTPLGLGLYQAAGLVAFASTGVAAETAVAAASGLQAVNYGATTLAAGISGLLEGRISRPVIAAEAAPRQPDEVTV